MIKRKKCIFCETQLNKPIFETDLNCFSGHYPIDRQELYFEKNPFNICVCEKCRTPQLKYLGNVNEVYKINHADNTGELIFNLHKINTDFIFQYKNLINNIIEVGCSVGTLSDMILEKYETNYHIIEPNFLGKTTNKKIINDYYENVEDDKIDADTLIMSHVFEHFYEPKKILKKITQNKKLKNFFLVFPDLEHYINNQILHVLNTEHTFYVDNDFLIKLISMHGFELIEKINYKNHSIIFYFRRNKIVENIDEIFVDFENKNYDLDLFFEQIKYKIEKYNNIIDKNDSVYIWPASIHSIYLTIFGLNYHKMMGFLDNSKLKIGKKMYGLNLPIESFEETVKNNKNKILINGGVFNQEIQKLLNDNCFI